MRFDDAAKLDRPAMVILDEGIYWCRHGKTPMTLCMCGLSPTAPRCDGSHRAY